MGHFLCAVLKNSHRWAGPQSDLMSAPSPLLGPQSDWYVSCLPLSQGQYSVEWGGPCLLLAHCQAWGAASRGSGQEPIRWGGSRRCTGVGGSGLAHFAISGPLQKEPCSTRREAGPSEGWIHRSTALGVCEVQASWVTGTGSLWNSGGDGREKWRLPAPLFPHQVLSFCGSTTLPPVIFSPSLLSESGAVDF